jgi:hypothetical protein
MESGGNKTAVINTSFIMIQTGKLILSVMSKNRQKHSRVELRIATISFNFLIDRWIGMGRKR